MDGFQIRKTNPKRSPWYARSDRVFQVIVAARRVRDRKRSTQLCRQPTSEVREPVPIFSSKHATFPRRALTPKSEGVVPQVTPKKTPLSPRIRSTI
ncbi:hypothetical protein BDN71DRAFT_628427 [Pleurotus eryngii]|uniref:Uncharacterized protein n=1 Tax=Pleurotus eryngii TaxID=5323 RepID=A0A9P6D9A7_PLEER|nr:hypothetical protein BDN71DRAFT_628427 [Pleurotus eryngii]